MPLYAEPGAFTPVDWAVPAARLLGNWELALPYNGAALAFAAYFFRILLRWDTTRGALELSTAFWIFATSLASIRAETSHAVFFDVSCRFVLATLGWGLCTLFVAEVATERSASGRVALTTAPLIRAVVLFTMLLAPLFALGLWNKWMVWLVFWLRYGCFWASLLLVDTRPFAFMRNVYVPSMLGLYIVARICPELWVLTPWSFFQDDLNFRVDLAGQYMVHPIMCLTFFACVSARPSRTESADLQLPSLKLHAAPLPFTGFVHLSKLMLMGGALSAILAAGLFPILSGSDDAAARAGIPALALDPHSRELLAVHELFVDKHAVPSAPTINHDKAHQRMRAGVAFVLILLVMTVSQARPLKRARPDQTRSETPSQPHPFASAAATHPSSRSATPPQHYCEGSGQPETRRYTQVLPTLDRSAYKVFIQNRNTLRRRW